MINSYLFNVSSLQPKSGTNTLVPDLDHTIQLTHPLGHLSSFHFEIANDELLFLTETKEPKNNFKTQIQPHPEWYYHDHVVLILDPKNDHMHQYLIGLNKDGSQISTVQIVMPGEEISDIKSRNLNGDHFVFKKEVLITATGWKSKIRIPLSSLDLKAWPSVMGVRVKFGFESDIIYPAVTWPAQRPEFGDMPLDFGKLLINTDFLMKKIDFGTPYWQTGEFTTNINLEGNSPSKNKNLALTVTNTNVYGKTETSQFPIQWKSNGEFEIKGVSDCHFANKWAPDFVRSALITLEIKDSKSIVWSATYPVGFDAGIILRDPFGKFKPNSVNRPQKNDPNFTDNFRCWLLSKLPDWVYQTTRNKAPSDFYLKDNFGKFNLNLMDENSIEQIADYIKSEFDDWQDGLCAMSLLLNHKFLTRHSGSWAALSGKANAGTVLRVGGCFCGDTSRVSAQISDLLGERYKVKLKGYSLGLRGHLTGMVDTPIGEILIDPMLGIYYHTHDNERLATLQEMREDKSIHERMWLLAYSNGHEFFINTHNQVKTPYRLGDYEYPGY